MTDTNTTMTTADATAGNPSDIESAGEIFKQVRTKFGEAFGKNSTLLMNLSLVLVNYNVIMIAVTPYEELFPAWDISDYWKEMAKSVLLVFFTTLLVCGYYNYAIKRVYVKFQEIMEQSEQLYNACADLEARMDRCDNLAGLTFIRFTRYRVDENGRALENQAPYATILVNHEGKECRTGKGMLDLAVEKSKKENQKLLTWEIDESRIGKEFEEKFLLQNEFEVKPGTFHNMSKKDIFQVCHNAVDHKPRNVAEVKIVLKPMAKYD